jgi:hypothetical protein
MSSGSPRLTHALKTLRERWDETKGYWRDEVARDFEKNHLAPLESQADNAIRGMEKLAEVFQKIRHDCS